MDAISNVGFNTSYQRPEPATPPPSEVRERQDVQSRDDAHNEQINAAQTEREQAKAPVVKGQGEVIDIEA